MLHAQHGCFKVRFLLFMVPDKRIKLVGITSEVLNVAFGVFRKRFPAYQAPRRTKPSMVRIHNSCIHTFGLHYWHYRPGLTDNNWQWRTTISVSLSFFEHHMTLMTSLSLLSTAHCRVQHFSGRGVNSSWRDLHSITFPAHSQIASRTTD